jgi:hypothetical protein
LSSKPLCTTSDVIHAAICHILNTIVEQLDIPQLLKSGILTLVLKKNKDRRNSSNYRGIAVTKIFTKIFQSVLKAELIRTLNPLQRGKVVVAFI